MSILSNWWSLNTVPFYQSVKPFIEKLALIPPGFSIEDDSYLLLVAAWDKSVNADKFNNLDYAIASFKEFCNGYEPDLLPVLPEIKLTFTVDGAVYDVNLKYGNGTNTIAALHDAIKRRGLIERELRQRYTGVSASVPVNAHPQTFGDNLGNIGKTETIEVVELRFLLDEKGNKRVRCAGGQFQKWGVPVYPETLRNYPDWLDKPFGIYPVKGTALIQLDPSGKPVKVISFKL